MDHVHIVRPRQNTHHRARHPIYQIDLYRAAPGPDQGIRKLDRLARYVNTILVRPSPDQSGKAWGETSDDGSDEEGAGGEGFE